MPTHELLQECIWIIKCVWTITTLRGVRQGGPISFRLFTATIQVFKNAQLEESGINLDGEKLLDVRFADDVVLTTEGV